MGALPPVDTATRHAGAGDTTVARVAYRSTTHVYHAVDGRHVVAPHVAHDHLLVPRRLARLARARHADLSQSQVTASGTRSLLATLAATRHRARLTSDS